MTSSNKSAAHFPETRLIVIQCSDRVGLVAQIASLLAQAKINIVSMREFVDVEAGQFFARLEADFTHAAESLEADLKAVLPDDARVEVKVIQPKKVVVLVTKEHHCLSDLLIRHHFKTAGFEIQAVIGNHDVLSDLCARFQVPFFHVGTEGKTKEAFEKELQAKIQSFSFDFVVLAKFMRILSPEFVASIPVIVNIHHSFLPAFIGANPYRKAFERGVKLIGATSHYVTNDLDEGPIITQQIIPVDHSYNANDMMKAGKEIEVAVLSRAIRLISEDRVFSYRNKTVIFE